MKRLVLAVIPVLCAAPALADGFAANWVSACTARIDALTIRAREEGAMHARGVANLLNDARLGCLEFIPLLCTSTDDAAACLGEVEAALDQSTQDLITRIPETPPDGLSPVRSRAYQRRRDDLVNYSAPDCPDEDNLGGLSCGIAQAMMRNSFASFLYTGLTPAPESPHAGSRYDFQTDWLDRCIEGVDDGYAMIADFEELERSGPDFFLSTQISACGQHIAAFCGAQDNAGDCQRLAAHWYQDATEPLLQSLPETYPGDADDFEAKSYASRRASLSDDPMPDCETQPAYDAQTCALLRAFGVHLRAMRLTHELEFNTTWEARE